MDKQAMKDFFFFPHQIRTLFGGFLWPFETLFVLVFKVLYLRKCLRKALQLWAFSFNEFGGYDLPIFLLCFLPPSPPPPYIYTYIVSIDWFSHHCLMHKRMIEQGAPAFPVGVSLFPTDLWNFFFGMSRLVTRERTHFFEWNRYNEDGTYRGYRSAVELSCCYVIRRKGLSISRAKRATRNARRL